MKSSNSLRCFQLITSLLLMLVFPTITISNSQVLREPTNPAYPSNDCGCPRPDYSIPVSSGMLTPFLPRIPNLEFGFLYSFGKNVRTGRFTADYVLPFKQNGDSAFFGEVHAEGWDFWKRPNVSITTPAGFTTITSTANNRVDVSLGGGYRTLLSTNSLLGVNGFYDTSRLFNKWYSSGGVGLEIASIIAGDDTFDLNLNWYGNLFNRDVLVNTFRNKGNSFDVEIGYSHSLLDQALDLRLKAVGYQFDTGTPIRGWRGGADLTTRDGVLSVRYEYGNDPLNGYYNTVGGFVNIGFQLENLLRGDNPFSFPEPVFRSPRNLRRLLGVKVRRNWHLPEAVVLARQLEIGTCPNLDGLKVISSVIPFNSDLLSGALPTVSTRNIKFCWCNLLTVPSPAFQIGIVYSGPTQYTQVLTLNTSSGCATVAYLPPPLPDPINVILSHSGPVAPLDFGTGGGISFLFNQ